MPPVFCVMYVILYIVKSTPSVRNRKNATVK